MAGLDGCGKCRHPAGILSLDRSACSSTGCAVHIKWVGGVFKWAEPVIIGTSPLSLLYSISRHGYCDVVCDAV